MILVLVQTKISHFSGDNMKIRNAILSAADSIERDTNLYDFMSTNITDGCGTSACALGWIGYHLGYKDNGHDAINKIVQAIGIGDATNKSQTLFYRLMDDISAGGAFCTLPPNKVAKDLRLFADKYHPEQDYIPASIRAIFTEQVAA